MARKQTGKANLEVNEAFLQYEEEIVNHPVYANMPDLRHEDGTIQWEAPSNRGSGVFQFSHDRRYQWWMDKAATLGIGTNEDKWISKVAKRIHPTKLHPCKVCGRVMDIRYCYLSTKFMKRVQKLPYYDGQIEMTETTHILDFLPAFVDTYGEIVYSDLPSLLTCSQMKIFPNLGTDLVAWTTWIENNYIPCEPSMLGPGAMANPPDRLDGFHTYNRCCRPAADKGRSKENLASYSTDRRAFENWSDGNWIIANQLMGFISSNAVMKQEACANADNGDKHPRPCSADHIGPISLGFCHRPEFQLLCKPCNSAKNNRMYFSDVLHLIAVEQTGETVTTWYATPVWNKCKSLVVDKETALRLSRVMRDNRSVAMMLLADLMTDGHYLLLLTLLNLPFADYEYDILPESVTINHQIVTARFSQKNSTLKYVDIQKRRKIRIAFTSLCEYAKKENRNSFQFTNQEIERKKTEIATLLRDTAPEYQLLNNQLAHAINSPEVYDAEINRFLSRLDYVALNSLPLFQKVRKLLAEIMELVAEELYTKWNDARYSRELEE